MDLYYLNFNNYYNRQVKVYATLSDYLSFMIDEAEANRNFNPANDITIKFVTNRDRDKVGDYILAVENGVINSRWFVLNGDRLRGGQYELTVRRDVVADYYTQTITSPCFIEKATLNTGDPMIFNREDMTVNQIKTSETLLKDRTGCAWVVGYIPNNSFSSTTTIESKYIVPNFNVDATYSALTDFPYYNLIGNNGCDKPYVFTIDTYVGEGNTASSTTGTTSRKLTIDLTSGYIDQSSVNKSWNSSSGYYFNTQLGTRTINANSFYGTLVTNTQNRDSVYNNFLSYLNFGASYISDITAFHRWNNKVIQVGTGNSAVYYRVNVVDSGDSPITSYMPAYACNDILVPYLVLRDSALYPISGSADNNTFYITATAKLYQIQLTQLYAEAQVTIDSNRTHLEDSPYDMFCIPYSDELVIKSNGTNFCTANKSLALSIATEIGKQSGSANIYDIQLLPYCPVQRAIQANGDFDIVNESYDVITNTNGDNLGVVIWCDHSNFTFDIAHQIVVSNPKVSNQCDMYRLVSPNYNGQFEFNVAMNGGMTKFNVDCSYKPYTPYIHVNPDFGLLYGSDFNDARGLICGGDFSLPQVSNPWANYQLQNKNYQAIFDRQIQNMQVNYKYQNLSQLISGGISAIGTGVTTGVLAGGLFGGLSGLASVGGLVTDYYMNRQLQNEAIDYTKDLFGYNLGNIQALPDSISKVSPFNDNNKMFPFLEYYTCTDTERQAFENKIKWNGMTVMRIGTIQEFIRNEETYIKGKIIRLLEVDEPTNVLNEIANEINKGVFINGGNTTSS